MFNIYFQDESRFGLFTRNGRALTAKGVKPICPYHHKFENRYLFGAFSPINGNSLIIELPYCNTDMFQIFLDEFSKLSKHEYKIMFLDNGAFHKAKRLSIPENIGLIFLPPYSPELNPAEKVWWLIKRYMNGKTHLSIKHLQNDLDIIISQQLTLDRIKSLTAYKLYLNAYRTNL
ncbi:MAG: IS630 family transposase [Bacteroidota bacterium]